MVAGSAEGPGQPLLRDAVHKRGREAGQGALERRAFACCRAGLSASVGSEGLIPRALEVPALSTFVKCFPLVVATEKMLV